LFESVWRPAHKAHRCFITCAGKDDGVGAQVQAVLSTMLFAEAFQLTYVHTPFERITHNELGANWEAEWERFFNLGKDEVAIKDIDTNLLEVVRNDNLRRLRRTPNVLYVVRHCYPFADLFPNFYLRMTDGWIGKYRSSSKEAYKSFYEEGKVNIAVHIRRGDVVESSDRYTGNRYHKALLSAIRRMLDDFKTDVSVHIYSQGAIADFDELDEMRVHYHLDECPFTTFYNLTCADMVVVAKSSFSYCAALLSGAVVVYEPFWHKPPGTWIVAEWCERHEEVLFDKAQLREQVHRLVTRMQG
jgi:hypothetical protein